MANDGDQHDERIGQQLSAPAFPPYPPVGEKPSSQLNQPNAISISTHHNRPSRGKVVLLIGLTLLIVGTIIGTMLQLWATHHSVQGGSGESRFIVSSTSLLARDYSLSGVAALSANDIWVIGDNPIRRPPRPQALFKHWNGSQWNVLKSPNPGKARNELSSVTVVSAHDIWAVGSFSNSTQGQIVEETLFMHWDGSQWSVVESPGPGNNNTLSDVAALSAYDVWSVGYETDIHGNSQKIIEHWDGTLWNIVKSPSPGTDDALYGMDRVPHSNNFIVVGTMYYGNGETGTVLYITDPGEETLPKS